MDKVNKMEVMAIPKLIANVSVPLMASMLVQSLYNIVDGIYVSRINENALTATSLAYSAQMLMLAVAVGTGVGVNSLLSRNLGRHDLKAVNQVAVNGLFLAIVCSIIFMVFGYFGSERFLSMFTDDAEILELGVQYLTICMVGCCGIFLATTGERLLQATGNTFLSMAAQTLGAVTNIVLDPILIFGMFGLPSMGIRGAAIATIMGQFVAAIAALGLNKVKNEEIHFEFRGFRPDGRIIKDVYVVGFPTMLTQMMGSFMMICMNRLLIDFSSAAVAFYGVYYKLWTFVYMPVSGLAQGQIPIVGYNYGAGKKDRIMETFKVTLAVAVLIMLIGTILFQAFPAQLLGLYKAGDEMMGIGVRGLKIISLTFPLAAVTITIGFCGSGMGNGLLSMIGTLLRQLVVLVPFSYYFATAIGLEYTWYAAWISESLAMIYAILHFRQVYIRKIKPL